MQSKKEQNTAGKLIWEIACRRLEKTVPAEVMAEIHEIKILSYDGSEISLSCPAGKGQEGYEEKYRDILTESLCWAAGHDITVNFQYKKKGLPTGKTTEKMSGEKHVLGKAVLTLVIAAAIFCALILGVNINSNKTFRETFYETASGKIADNLRIIHLSDLHNSTYGADNSELIRRIELLAPDIIVMTGDMTEKSDGTADVTVELCKSLVNTAPVYYIYGNNEESEFMNFEAMEHDEIESLFWEKDRELRLESFKDLDGGLRELLEAAGVNVLWNEKATVEVKGISVDIFGILTGDTDNFWNYIGEDYESFLTEDKDHFKLLLSHEPYIFETFGQGEWADLILCGQTHGGVVRLPKLGGLYEHKNGFFPELKGAYVYGQYDLGGPSLIVSSGLTNRKAVRINNQPELVVVDVARY